MLSNPLNLNSSKRSFSGNPARPGNDNLKNQILKNIKQVGVNSSSPRFRLIGWYVLLLVLTLLVFSVYIFFQFRNLEQNQQDMALQATVSRVANLIDPGSLDADTATLHFRNFNGPQGNISDLNRDNIQVRLVDLTGKVTGSLGAFVSEMPLISTSPTQAGFTTLTNAENAQWRIYSQPVAMQGRIIGWLQLGQPVYLLDAGLNSFFTPIVLGALIAMLLAVLGGLFLANQALRPIDKVTRTAQVISTRDLSRRIDYDGPADEIGRLAQTLDQMLDRLEKGFEQERRFTSDASHELRTPLTALKGRIEVTLSRSRSGEEYQQTLLELNREVDRLVRLSNELLYLARLEQSGPSEQQFENLNLSELLDSMVDSLQASAELKQIELTTDISDELYLPGNLDQLTRLFLNLVDNALKYTPEGGRIIIRAKKLEKTGQVYISVSDNGPGIAREHLPRLFQRFYRAQSDRASTTGGAGLGLAIAHEIARQQDGTLEVESQEGKGSTFKVLLPFQNNLVCI